MQSISLDSSGLGRRELVSCSSADILTRAGGSSGRARWFWGGRSCSRSEQTGAEKLFWRAPQKNTNFEKRSLAVDLLFARSRVSACAADLCCERQCCCGVSSTRPCQTHGLRSCPWAPLLGALTWKDQAASVHLPKSLEVRKPSRSFLCGQMGRKSIGKIIILTWRYFLCSWIKMCITMEDVKCWTLWLRNNVCRQWRRLLRWLFIPERRPYTADVQCQMRNTLANVFPQLAYIFIETNIGGQQATKWIAQCFIFLANLTEELLKDLTQWNLMPPFDLQPSYNGQTF